MDSIRKIKLMRHVLAISLSLGLYACGGNDSQENLMQFPITPEKNAVEAQPVNSSASSVVILPERVDVNVGEELTIDVWIKNLQTPTEGGGVTLRFNPDVLKVSDIKLNSESWKFKNHGGEIDATNGVIYDILVSDYNGVSADAVIASVSFTAKAPGSADIRVEESLKNPFSAEGKKINPNLSGNSITINPTN